jgi:hypothetical protein
LGVPLAATKQSEGKLISVVIPLYNKGEFIGRAIDSVLAQTDAQWSLWVVDDGSTDQGVDVVRACTDPRVHLLQQANGGVSAARNAGVAHADSEWVAFLDADDYWAPDHLHNLTRALAAHPDAAMCATAYFVVDEAGSARKIVLPPELNNQVGLVPDYFDQILRFEHPVHSSAVMVRKSAFTSLGGFPLGVSQGEDIIVWAQLACMGPLAYCGSASAYYVAPPVSVAARPHALRRPQTPDKVGQALQALAGRCPNPHTLKAFLAEWYRIRAMLFMERNERRACLKELLLATRSSGWRLRDVVSVGMLALPLSARQRLLAAIRQVRRQEAQA